MSGICLGTLWLDYAASVSILHGLGSFQGGAWMKGHTYGSFMEFFLVLLKVSEKGLHYLCFVFLIRLSVVWPRTTNATMT